MSISEDFSNRGFEPQGTVLAQRLEAWKNLQDASTWDGMLSMYPEPQDVTKKPRTAMTVPPVVGTSLPPRPRCCPLQETPSNGSQPEVRPADEEEGSYGRLGQSPPASKGRKRKKDPQDARSELGRSRRKFGPMWKRRGEGAPRNRQRPRYFCSEPWGVVTMGYPNPPGFEMGGSIPHFIALLHNLSSCMDITATDVQKVFKRLEACAPHYHSMKLSHDCASGARLCRGVPAECIEYNAVYTILHYLADVDFLSGQGRLLWEPHLSYTSVFLPLGQSTMAMAYFKDLEEYGHLEDDVTQVVGMELGLKHALFDEYLLHDTVYVALAGVTVLAAMWAYTQSFLVTAVTCMAVVFSLGTAYFLYTTVFRISFFPFMNVLTLTIAIGIGAYIAFIYCKTWGAAKAEKNSGTLVKLVRDTLHHACLSMLVTSVTTAAAFFASCVSSITAVRCFGLFAGTAVLASFFFTVTWLPAALIVAEKWCFSTCCLCVPPFGVYLPRLKRFCACAPSPAPPCGASITGLSEAARVFYDKLLSCIVIRLRWFWLLSLALVAAGGAVAIFVHPRLRLLESPEF
nr:protein dispatched homolog 1-like [Rhipicephalus microplus]